MVGWAGWVWVWPGIRVRRCSPIRRRKVAAQRLQRQVRLEQQSPRRQAGHRRVEVVAAARQVQIAAGFLAGTFQDAGFHLKEQVLHFGRVDECIGSVSPQARPERAQRARPGRSASAAAATSISRCASLASSIGSNSHFCDSRNCGPRMVSAYTGCWKAAHPLSPVSATPRMMCRWKMANTISTGTVAMLAPVMISSQREPASPYENCDNPTGSVRMSGS